jgi:dihydropteroate synthase
MAVMNLSPESRIRQSIVAGVDAALERAHEFRSMGATIIDLGAQSSHFENRELTVDEEWSRLEPVLRVLVSDGFLISVDSWKPEVLAAAVAAGAVIVNDTGGLQHPDSREAARSDGIAAIAMYIEGKNPLQVDQLTVRESGGAGVLERMRPFAAALEADGLRQLILDPGLSINYRSNYEEYGLHQLDVIRSIPNLRSLGHPVMIPVPRKADTHRMLMYLTLSIEHGADIIRVHDVEAACDLVRLMGRAPR